MGVNNPITSGTYNYQYSIAVQLVPNAASAGDVLTISGTDSPRSIIMSRLRIYGTTTLGLGAAVNVIRRSTPSTGGGAVVRTPVPFDAATGPAMATVTTFTGTPTVGTLVGNLASGLMNLQVSTAVPSLTEYSWSFNEGIYGPVLRSSQDTLAINFGGIAIVGGNLVVTLEWLETPP